MAREQAEGLGEATRSYERWLATFMPLVAEDVAEKHRRMGDDPFRFMRATFYRFCQLWREHAGSARNTARVLAVGDLHIENFGTWRDADGRLVWGTNDFDEATRLPFALDLVRLTASALLAIRCAHLTYGARAAAQAVWEGYAAGLECGGRPFVLEEEHGWLRRLATGKLRSPPAFWEKLGATRAVRTADAAALRLIRQTMPERDLELKVGHRVAGLGSLGRPRYLAIAEWNGGLVAREAKAAAPSAWVWAGGGGAAPLRYRQIVDGAVRAPDPMLAVTDRWVVRRLAPHCTRIELIDMPNAADEQRLLASMGFEVANVHLGTPGARARILGELRRFDARRLCKLAKRFADLTERDWSAWRRLARAR